MATLAPKAAKLRAMPRPIPDPPPVTTATRSVSRIEEVSIGMVGDVTLYDSRVIDRGVTDVESERAPSGDPGQIGGLRAQDRADSAGPEGARAAPHHRRGGRGGPVRHTHPAPDLRLQDAADRHDRRGAPCHGQGHFAGRQDY